MKLDKDDNQKQSGPPSCSSMTAHEFARSLLRGPNLPIFVPKVVTYDDGDTNLAAPVVDTVTGEDRDEKKHKILIVSYRSA